MKPRNKKSCRICTEMGDTIFADGEQTVFGLFITPKVSWSGKFGEGFAITEPTTGYSICYGKTKLEALILLRRKANEKREEWGSFRAAIFEQARNQRILQILKERAA
jgi:hypothetical protein